MKSFLTLSAIIILVFAGTTAYLTMRSGRVIDDLQKSRAEMNRISTLASDITQAEAQLAELTPVKRQKLQHALPTPFDVGNKLTDLAAQHSIFLTLTPLSGTSNTATPDTPQELQALLKLIGPNVEAIQSFLKDLEEGPLFVTIKNLTITPEATATNATLGIGVFIQ